MNRERILSLLELLQSSAAAELAVGEGDTYIRLRRGAPAPAPAAAGSAPAAAAAFGAPAGSAAPLAAGGVQVIARLVGLFHAGAEPGAEPLVQVGQQVKEGQTVATVESLRQITSVTAPVAGTVREILAEENQAVQYGDVLMILDPGGE